MYFDRCTVPHTHQKLVPGVRFLVMLRIGQKQHERYLRALRKGSKALQDLLQTVMEAERAIT